MIKRQKGWQLEGLEWATAMSLSPRGSLCDALDGVKQCECLTVLLRYNFRNTISFSHLECTMQWPLGTILSWATIPTVQFRDTSVTPQRPLVPIYGHPHPQPCLCRFAFLDISHKRDHIICALCIWLLSVSIMILRFIHGKVTFFYKEFYVQSLGFLTKFINHRPCSSWEAEFGLFSFPFVFYSTTFLNSSDTMGTSSQPKDQRSYCRFGAIT